MTPSGLVTLDELLAALLACLEGSHLVAYPDSGGVWSIGLGSTKDVRAGMTITPAEQAERFAEDSAPLIKVVQAMPLLEGAAYGSFGYNCGPRRSSRGPGRPRYDRKPAAHYRQNGQGSLWPGQSAPSGASVDPTLKAARAGAGRAGDIAMHPQAAAMVFESWAPHPDYPEQVGRIVCCGVSVVQRRGVIQCDACDTAVEIRGDRWVVLRVKGRPFETGRELKPESVALAVDQPAAGSTVE